ncbi:hypothetical protein HPB50_011411 [Hyalomma asiaticum]|uniref:Uncharacterized protein n=1 Tax=Hyalomma asiaticum TaxID=266040 RepID=A0ACB7T224_HYAAI|nr:hypothetical protein HPB50_011411 [Hyalomma asiaticum]
MAAAMYKCLVTHGDKNVVVPFVGPWKRAQLFEYLKRERAFAGIDFGNASLTVFDEDFRVHVEVTDDFIIADKSKLELKEGSQYRYPGKLYEEAARELVTKFPSLADSTGTGYLRYKAKYQRRKLKVQDEADSPLPHKRVKKAEESTQKRVSRPSLACDMGDAEDEASILMHVTGMQKESKKASPDVSYLEDSMMRTFVDRRQWISEKLPTVQDILDRYPALAISSVEPEAVYLVPTVTYTGQILTTVDFIVHLEMLRLPAASLLEAIATQMALYWTFDIVFCAKTQKTFDLICRLLGVGSGVQATPLVRVAHTLLQK